MKATKMQEKHGQLLKLVAGTVMLALAGTMIFAPQIMEDVLGATLIFAAAIAAAAIIHWVYTRKVRPVEEEEREPTPVG
jgi:hypothetical protein